MRWSRNCTRVEESGSYRFAKWTLPDSTKVLRLKPLTTLRKRLAAPLLPIAVVLSYLPACLSYVVGTLSYLVDGLAYLGTTLTYLDSTLTYLPGALTYLLGTLTAGTARKGTKWRTPSL